MGSYECKGAWEVINVTKPKKRTKQPKRQNGGTYYFGLCIIFLVCEWPLSFSLSFSLSLSPPSFPPVLNVMEKELVQKEEQDSKMAIEASLADLSSAAVCIIWCCIFACVVPNSQLAEGRRHKYMYTYIYIYMYDIYIYIPHHHYHPGQKNGIGRTGQFV